MKIVRSSKRGLKEKITDYLFIVGLIAGAWAAVTWAPNLINGYVDSRIDQKLLDQQFLGKLSKRVRPFCIFDNKGSIHLDSGAMEFIGYGGTGRIDFAKLDKQGIPTQITIHFNQLFIYPPILSITSGGLHTFEAKRGTNYDWVYTIYSDAPLLDSNSNVPASDEVDYKLELLLGERD